MIKRVIEVSHAGTHLSVQYEQLVVRREKQERGRIPCEDIGILLVDHSGVTYTHSVFTKLLKYGAAVVLCGQDHHPAGMILPLEGNSEQTLRYKHQINAKVPVKKRLWQQIIKAKINHQASNVQQQEDAYRALKELYKQVRSGDPDNIEARAAKIYWKAYLQDYRFQRNRDGKVPNNMLNYGYMVVRAAIARALCSAGLLPSFGIHHRNKYNAFCLADDIIEPFRGFVEKQVREIYYEGYDQDLVEKLDQSIKARILEVLYMPVRIAGFTGPLMVGLHRTCASIVRCFMGEQKYIDLPEVMC